MMRESAREVEVPPTTGRVPDTPRAELTDSRDIVTDHAFAI